MNNDPLQPVPPAQPQVPPAPQQPQVAQAPPAPVAPPPVPKPLPQSATLVRSAMVMPSDEAAILRERDAAERVIAEARAETAPTPTPQLTREISPVAVEGVETTGSAPGAPLPEATAPPMPGSFIDTPLPQKVSVATGLPPLKKEEEAVLEQYAEGEDEKVSWLRLILTGVVIALTWLVVNYALNWAAIRLLGEALKLNSDILNGSSSWSWMLLSIPYIAALITVFIARRVLKYEGEYGRRLVPFAMTFFVVGLVELAPKLPVISEHLGASVLAMATLFNLPNMLENGLLPLALKHIGLTIAVSVLATGAIYGLVRFTAKLPTRLRTILLVTITVLPIASAFAVDKLSETAAERGEPAYTIVDEGGEKKIVGAKGFAEGKRFFMSKVYEGYDEKAYGCVKSAHPMRGMVQCDLYCAASELTGCVEVSMASGASDKDIESQLTLEPCSLGTIRTLFAERSMKGIIPEGYYTGRMTATTSTCSDVRTPGGETVRASAWSTGAGSTTLREYAIAKDGMVAYVKIQLRTARMTGGVALAQEAAHKDALQFLDTFKVIGPW